MIFITLINIIMGDYRLYNGRGPYLEKTNTGRLEMFYRNKWTPICNEGFSRNLANYICQKMGYKKHQWYSTVTNLM